MSRPHILIIEDHKDFRKALKHFLQAHQVRAEMIEASSGEEGVLLAKKNKMDIVVTDFALGGIDGLEAARQIKKSLPDCRIIMLTIYDPKEIFRRDTHRTISFFISKGDLHELLVPAINRVLCDSGKSKIQ
jgi:DNA-binding NarL/FixJ family response regulator